MHVVANCQQPYIKRNTIFAMQQGDSSNVNLMFMQNSANKSDVHCILHKGVACMLVQLS